MDDSLEARHSGTFCSGNSEFMPDVNVYSQILCSIAGIENTFGGRSKLRRLIHKILFVTSSTYVEARRPVFQPSLSFRLINNLNVQLDNLERTDDLFQVSFDYVTRENNEKFIELVLELWFEYEQPFFCFFQSYSSVNRKIESEMTWKDFIASEICLTFFKSAEENVVWIGKSEMFDTDWEDISTLV